MSERKPHRFLVTFDEPECGEIWAEVRAGSTARADEMCQPVCWRVTEVVCPYGDDKPDCQLIQECNCVNPEDDERFEPQAKFTYEYSTFDDLVANPPRRVWDRDAKLTDIARTLEFEEAMDEWEDKHPYGGSWEASKPAACWVVYAGDWQSLEDELEESLGGSIPEPGWYAAFVENGGALDDSYVILDAAVKIMA